MVTCNILSYNQTTRPFETRLIKMIDFKIHFTWYELEVNIPAVDTEHYC